MNSLDTNLLLRFLLNDVPSQAARAKKAFSKPTIYISDVVVSEVAFVLEKALSFDRIYSALLLKTLISLPNLLYNDYFMPDVIALYEKRKSLSFVDCYAAVEAGKLGAILYTFDKKLVNQGGSHVVEP